MSDLLNRRIVVTGGAGFLGRHVCAVIEDFDPAFIFVPRRRDYDLTRPEDIERLLQDTRPDIIIHLAAVVGGIGANQRHPGKYFYENAVMGIQLMEASRLASVEKFVNVGTICSYPKYTPVPFKEGEIWNGYPEETNAAYGLAKKMLIVQGQAYREEYGFNAINLLPVNLYGPEDNFDLQSSHVIPALIRKAVEANNVKAKEFAAWGSGNASREFLFVKDAALGIALAADRYNDPAPVNLGSGYEISIRDLAEKICDIVGYEGRILWDQSKPDGQPRRCLDTTRAKETFGFAATTTLEEGLVETVRWYKEQAVSSFVVHR